MKKQYNISPANYIIKGGPLLANTNGKLGKFIFHFSMPAIVTCPGSTDLCQSLCYATDGNYHIPTVKEKLYSNYLASKETEFFESLRLEIKLLSLQEIKHFRIHASGDFYSQKYLNGWLEIIRSFPKITFLAYTRSFMLDFSQALGLANFSLFYSVDSSTVYYPSVKLKTARMVASDKPAINTFTCKSTCDQCKACYKPALNMSVQFLLHGSSGKAYAKKINAEVN